MKVTLNSYTPLVVCSNAIRECWQSQDKSDNGGEKDLALIDRVGNQFKHSSTLEHLTYSFTIDGISRACLQELARHRLTSLSVKSTRYTLKELKTEEEFLQDDFKRANTYIVLTGNKLVDNTSITSLENLRKVISSGVSNDVAKYCLPECYKTSLAWTLNARSLQNFLTLRSSKAALWEIRDLASNIYLELPEDHKFLFSNSGEIREVAQAMQELTSTPQN